MEHVEFNAKMRLWNWKRKSRFTQSNKMLEKEPCDCCPLIKLPEVEPVLREEDVARKYLLKEYVISDKLSGIYVLYKSGWVLRLKETRVYGSEILNVSDGMLG